MPAPMPDGALAGILKRDRLVVGLALAVLTALAWGYTLTLAAQMNVPVQSMDGMSGMTMPDTVSWSLQHALFICAMWTVMTIGMMTPSVAPMVLIYTQVARQAAAQGKAFAPAGWFAGGYLVAWASFAVLATAAQYGLERAALLTPAMASNAKWLSGGMLIAAGLYQFVSLKQGCLAGCRAPLAFVQQHGGFKADFAGSLRLGFLHGLYCIGCCWALMALLFVGGMMNVLWIAGLMILVLAEKVIPGGLWFSRAVGFAALAAGFYTLVR